MAQKTIVQLQEATEVDSSQSFLPVDNGTQTFKVKLTNLLKLSRQPVTAVTGTTPITVAAGAVYAAANGGVPFNLPASPQPGTRFTIKDKAGSFSAAPCFVNPNGAELIEGLNAPYELATDWGAWEFYFDGTNWLRV